MLTFSNTMVVASCTTLLLKCFNVWLLYECQTYPSLHLKADTLLYIKGTVIWSMQGNNDFQNNMKEIQHERWVEISNHYSLVKKKKVLQN